MAGSGDSGLNEAQRQAVAHTDGPLVVFAGAGSGKTRVITHRIAQLVERAGVRPWRILAVTFTNKAAGEMRERLLGLCPEAEGLWVGTFHSICARLLRRHAEELGLNPNFVIYDDTDQKAMVTRIIRDLDLDEKRYAPREIASRINRAKRELQGPGEVDLGDYFAETFQRIYALYEERMASSGALDFGDLLYRMALALRDHAGVRAQLQGQWDHVLVDEFQDTNRVQLEIVRELVAEHRNLCVVGDDDQSIYRWRGAERRYILEFRQEFTEATVIKLEQNYRSHGNILGAATSVIGRNHDREPKTLWTDNPAGEPVRIVRCSDERDEARAVSEVLRRMRADGMRLSDMAIFYRTHAQSRVFEEEMRACNLPYRVIGGQRFYERAEVKDCLAYLRVLMNPDDDVSLLRVINTPTRGIGKTTQERILDRAAQSGTSVWTSLRHLVDEKALARGATGKLAAFAAIIEGLSGKMASGAGPAELLEAVLAETSYLDVLKAQDSVEADARIENVQELLGSVSEFEEEAEQGTLPAYLELVTLQSNVDELDAEDRLTMMTVHAAKGLEFPFVWVAGLEERLFPMSREEEDVDDMEEERRLAYVAFTRAERHLWTSFASTRRIWGQMKIGLPSRFIEEIPPEHTHKVERGGSQHAGFRVAEPAWSRGRTAAASRGGSGRPGRDAPRRPAVPQGDSFVDRSEADGIEIGAGAQVRHAKFGLGQVERVDSGVPPKVTVRFPGWGTKQIVARFLEPA